MNPETRSPKFCLTVQSASEIQRSRTVTAIRKAPLHRRKPESCGQDPNPCKPRSPRTSTRTRRFGSCFSDFFRTAHFEFRISLALLLATFAFSALCQDTTGALSPANLRCEYTANPQGVDVLHPRLFWIVQSDERDQRQSAYQVLVASSTNRLAHDTGDMWDSGKVQSAATIHIHYAGQPLRSAQRVFWKVRVWDQDDNPSDWSETATWTMGVLNADDWKAKWICAPAATETLLLRKEFDVRGGLVRAVAFVTGLGQYEMTLNGARAGNDLLSPGWTDYDKTVLYDTKDVTSLLHEGHNVIGLGLGNGMYNVVRRNRYVKFTGSFGPLRAICQLQLEYADGSTQVVGTDDSWSTLAGPTVFSNIYGGEDYDARLNPVGWEHPGFDDSSWPLAVEVIRPKGTLRGQSESAPSLKAIEVRQPVEVRSLANGDMLYDLGQNTAYLPRIRIVGQVGSSVRLLPGEIINPDGTVNQRTMGAGGRGYLWWEYTKGTPNEETWMPKFCYIGCRYIQAHFTPADKVEQAGSPRGESEDDHASSTAPSPPSVRAASLPQIKSLEGVVMHSSARPVGAFECSNALLNRIHSLVRWAQMANMVSVLTDCPHREKLGWLEQYHLNGPSLRYEFDVARIFNKGMNDMAEAQLEDGLVPNIAPEYTQFKGTFRAATEWGSAFIIVPWQQYQFDADLDLLRQHYGQMKRYFAYLESRATNNIVSEGLGDWYDLGPKKPDRAQLTPPPVTASAFYYYDAKILSLIAGQLHETEDAKAYADRAERIRASYNRHFFHADQGQYATGSQCANALPLVFGIVQPEHRKAVLAALVHDVEAHGDSMTAGDVGFRFLLLALAEGGRSDLIYRMINQQDKPGYGYQLKQGATSLCESWDANDFSSHDHFMLGQIIEWFYQDLAGIRGDPAGPGFKKIIINPQPVGDLTWVKASYDSIRGKIVSEWKRSGGQFTLHLTIPANTTATVFIPTESEATVMESGVRADQVHGIKLLRRENARTVWSVTSGSYQFFSEF